MMNHGTKYRISAVDGLREREDSTGKTSYFSVNGKTLGELHIDSNQRTKKLTVYAGFIPHRFTDAGQAIYRQCQGSGQYRSRLA